MNKATESLVGEMVDKLCNAVWEMSKSYKHDLCGDHREFYGKRISRCLMAATLLFPEQMARALEADETVKDD